MKYNNKQQKPTGDNVAFRFPYKPEVQVDNRGGNKNFIEMNKNVYDWALGTKKAVIAKPLEIKKEPFNAPGVPNIPKVTKLTLVNKGEIKGYQQWKNQQEKKVNVEAQGNKVSDNLHYNKGKSSIVPLREPEPEKINQHKKGALPIILEESSLEYPFPSIAIVKKQGKQEPKENNVFPNIAVVRKQPVEDNVAGLKTQKRRILPGLNSKDNPFGNVARVVKVKNVVQSQPIRRVMPEVQDGKQIFETGQNAGRDQKLPNPREYVKEFCNIFSVRKNNNIRDVLTNSIVNLCKKYHHQLQ